MKKLVGIAFAALAAAGVLASAASAATIQVKPGKNAIQRAVNRADAGDRLLVKRGTYREDVVVDKRLRIVGQSKRRPTIDGQCETNRTIDIVSNGVTLRNLKVLGGGYANVNITGVERAAVRRLGVRETCDGTLYGINVFQTGAIELTGNRVTGGFTDAAVYVGAITDTNGRNLLVEGNNLFGNTTGLLVEDVVGPGGKFLARENFLHDNRTPGVRQPAGLALTTNALPSTERTRYVRNRITGNPFAITINSQSSDNVFIGNRLGGNDMVLDDQGARNCGRDNRPNVFPAC